MTDDHNSQAELEYSRLRDWYLARLRRNALEKAQGSDLTPLALIQKDQLLVKQLGEKAAPAVIQQNGRVSARSIFAYGIPFAVWLVIAVLCMLGQADPSQMLVMIYKMTLAAFVGDTADQTMSFLPSWLVGLLSALFFAIPAMVTLFFHPSAPKTETKQ